MYIRASGSSQKFQRGEREGERDLRRGSMCVAARSKVRARVRGMGAGGGTVESGRERERESEGRGQSAGGRAALTSNGY